MGNLCIDFNDVSESISNAWRCADAHQNDDAELLFQRAVCLDQTNHSRIEYAEFLADCVSIDLAIEQLEMSLDSVHPESCQSDFISICNRIASLHRELGNVPQSFRYQQYAIAAEMKRFDNQANCLLYRSTTLGFAQDLIQKREIKPAKFLLTSLSMSDDFVGNEARISLADLYNQEEEFTAAHFLLDQVTQWLAGRDEIPLSIQTLELRSQVLTAQKKFISARELLNEAIALAGSTVRCARFLPQLRLAQRKLALQMSILCQKSEWN